jgi:protein-S-isoprenylcysteine O-methyltransferase Ste14
MKTGKILPPTFFNGALILMILLHFTLPVIRVFYFPYNLSGIPVIISGIFLNLWTDRLFKNFNTTVKPFEESAALIIEGPFRFSRNPMYLGMALILLGLFVLLGTLSPFLVIPVFLTLMHYKFITAEEEVLEKRFGNQFLEYKSRVRSWI